MSVASDGSSRRASRQARPCVSARAIDGAARQPLQERLGEARATQFADKLHRTAIEETGTGDEQVDAFLRDTGEFAAITYDGAYVPCEKA